MRKAILLVLLVIAMSTQCGGQAKADPHGPNAAFAFGTLEHGRGHPSMNGVKPTTYRGVFYARTGQRGEQFRLCVIGRESNGHYWSVNSGGYAGAYQFSPQFERGLPHIVVRALKADGLPQVRAQRLRERLSRIPIHRWSRTMQDTAFFAVLNYAGPFSGWRHWSLRGSRCNALLGS